MPATVEALLRVRCGVPLPEAVPEAGVKGELGGDGVNVEVNDDSASRCCWLRGLDVELPFDLVS